MHTASLTGVMGRHVTLAPDMTMMLTIKVTVGVTSLTVGVTAA
jgi:hypothetical protein